MRFDDRLATVLGQPAGDAHGRAVQWRQLVELLARGKEQGSPELQAKALQRVAQLMGEVPPSVLAATARAIAGQPVPSELVALFAARGRAASAALVTSAELDSSGWAAVRAVAAPDVLPLLPPPEETPPSPPPPPPPPPPPTSTPPPVPAVPEPVSAPPNTPAQALPQGLFRWECGPTGEIDWVEGVPRAAMIGRTLAESFAEPFAARMPFSDEPLVLAEEGPLAGEWRWSGTPAFFPDTGRFAGYRGFARREGAASAESEGPSLPQDDELRELVHELRTPLNAIIGFGEIIEGQYLGPAHRAYRSRAAVIVREARRLADAVDTLDLAAKLRSGRTPADAGASLDHVRDALASLRDQAAEQAVRVLLDDRLGEGQLAIPPALAERLVRQIGTFVVDVAAQGEGLGVVLDRIGEQLALAFDRPRALALLSEEQLLGGGAVPQSRFPLRLVQGLATMVGGRLDIAPDRLVLLLPLKAG